MDFFDKAPKTLIKREVPRYLEDHPVPEAGRAGQRKTPDPHPLGARYRLRLSPYGVYYHVEEDSRRVDAAAYGVQSNPVEVRERPRALVALDCDGTLLDPRGEITPRVREAVRAATEAGALVTLATGRRLEGAKRYAEALGVRTPLVLLDGAAVQDPFSGELFHTDPVPAPLVRSVVDLAAEYGLHPVVYRITADSHGDTIHVLEGADEDPVMARYLASRSPVERGGAEALLAARPTGRASAMGQEKPARRLYAHMVDRAAELCCRVLFSPPVTYAQYPFSAVLVSNGGCTKARAIAVLAAQHGLSLGQCVAVGDAENDVEILREVAAAGGSSAAMGQAPETVKTAARYVVPSNAEDGVAVAIERYVLPQLQRSRTVAAG